MKKLLCALCAMTLLATATGCSNNNADKDKKETSGNTLVVASNNIDAKSQPDVDAQRKLLEENGVEIFGLQEVDNMTRRNHYDVVSKFKVDPYKDAFFSNAIAFSGGEYGIATVSKYEFRAKMLLNCIAIYLLVKKSHRNWRMLTKTMIQTIKNPKQRWMLYPQRILLNHVYISVS